MSQQNVREFVCHHAHDFTLGGGGVEHAALDEHRSARQRKRVDLLQVHWRERILEDGLLQFRGSSNDKPIAQLAEIAGDALVLDDRVLLADFGGSLASDFDVLFRRVLVVRRLDHRLGEQTGRRHRQHEDARGADLEYHDRVPFSVI
jgi:hypothetical protein